MDVISHGLVGNIFKEASRVKSLGDKVAVISFAVIPDLPGSAVVCPLLGREKVRPYWIPRNSDWIGVHADHPLWAALWEVPHSLFFLVLVVVPLVLWLRLPRIAIVSYLSHILLDLPTHTGEWAERPFCPFDITVNGFTDAWAWPLSYWVLSWVVLLTIACLVRFLLGRKPAAPRV